MKLFVATDIHGSAYWAKRATEAFAQSGADFLVLLGDIYYHGPRNPFPRDYSPKDTAEIFNSCADKIIAVRGNCDSEVDAMISNFPIVRDCIVPLGKRRVFFTHGHIFNKNNLPAIAAGDVLVYGHFHVNQYALVNGVHCLNVGSAALPKDRPAFCILDETGAVLMDDDEEILSVRFDASAR